MPGTAPALSPHLVACFGPTFADIANRRRAVARAKAYRMTLDSFAMSVLSDVQEMIERGDSETARQRINLVKWLLDNRAELEG